MAAVALRTSLNFIAATLSHYGLSLGHGAMTIFVGVAVYVTGDLWKYGGIFWG